MCSHVELCAVPEVLYSHFSSYLQTQEVHLLSGIHLRLADYLAKSVILNKWNLFFELLNTKIREYMPLVFLMLNE